MQIANCKLQIGWLVLWLLAGCEAPSGISSLERVLYEKGSMYHHILVSEDVEARYVRFGYGNIQSAMTLAEPAALRVPYTAYLTVGLAFVRSERALMIGLAGGGMVRFLQAHRPEIELDVVEIDPDVVDVARRFFQVEEGPGCRIHVGDGRVFVRRAARAYDWVMLDAFHSDTIPHHLTTVEFLKEVKGVLTPGGVVTANIAPLGSGGLYLAMIRTFAAVFPQVYLFQVPNRANIVLVATLDERRVPGVEIAASIRKVKEEAGPALDLLVPAGSYLEQNPVVEGAPVLTDDYAPVDLLRSWKPEGWRIGW